LKFCTIIPLDTKVQIKTRHKWVELNRIISYINRKAGAEAGLIYLIDFIAFLVILASGMERLILELVHGWTS
jgi:hypothetical protein